MGLSMFSFIFCLLFLGKWWEQKFIPLVSSVDQWLSAWRERSSSRVLTHIGNYGNQNVTPSGAAGRKKEQF